jgi:hypothetical protein
MPIFQSNKILNRLRTGKIKLEGKFIHGSNYTFLVEIYPEDAEPFLAVYKPVEGERILWDFPDNTLALREVAAFLIAQALGWQLVPPTAFRDNGPYGSGSVQLFIEHDPNLHYFSFEEAHIQRLRSAVLFDLLLNNADRKGGHIILDKDNHLWLIDHGLCFHPEEKLRTVIWNFAGESIPNNFYTPLKELTSKLDPPSKFVDILEKFLSLEEITALTNRTKALVDSKEFPFPPKDRRAYPFPPV